MITDWKSEILKGVQIPQRIEALDRGRLWQRHLPEVAAPDDEIAATEEGLGFKLDPRYQEFLRNANGWRSFYQSVDLFGTLSLLGAAPMDSALRQLRAMQPSDFEMAVGMPLADVLPIGASSVQRDMFLITSPWSSKPGIVLWFASREVDRFATFDEFYLTMLDYNRREVEYLEGEAKGP